MITLQGIEKYYRTGSEPLHVLKHIDLHVQAGEFLSVLGPSGSGKSTLMNLIGCMDTWDSGTYCLDGANVGECPAAQLAALRNEKIGFIFQKYQLIAQYTVLQNVMMPLLLRGQNGKEAAAQATEVLCRLGMQDKLLQRPSNLSGGQQQRAAVARALVTRPAVLLADEPTGALDSQTGKEVLRLFQELHRSGHTIVMITHDISVAAAATRTVRIDDGRLYG